MTQAFNIIADFIEAPAPPESARSMAALLLIDTLAVAAGAHHLEPARIARDHVLRFHAAAGPEHSASLLFDGRRASIPGAAFAAATQIDNLDGHDGFNPTKGHIGCAAVPALLAFAEAHRDLSSRDALDILVMAYEVAARAAMALHGTVSDYHTSGAWNGIAVAALGCRLLGASRAQLREAMGIAEYHGPRSQMMREISNPTMLHDGSGMGALTGAMAALLALDGFTGAPAITVEAPEVSTYWSDLGQRWTIEENYIKPYPVCRWAHAPLDGLQRLMRAHALEPDQIVKVEVRTFAESAALYPGLPSTTGQAQYSLAFALAAMMRHGDVGPARISGTGLQDESVAHLLERITIEEDPMYSTAFPAHRRADVAVHLTDGTTLRSGVVDARGGPEDPLIEKEVEAKLHLFADPTIGAGRASQLWQMRHAMLEPDHRFCDLIKLVTAPA